jgi:hypothetical protein
MCGREFPNTYLAFAVQTLDLFDRTSERVLRLGQLRGHFNLDSYGHIQEWLDGRGSRVTILKVCGRKRGCTRGSMYEEMEEAQGISLMTGSRCSIERGRFYLRAAAYRYLSFETSPSRRPPRPYLDSKFVYPSDVRLIPWPILSSTW